MYRPTIFMPPLRLAKLINFFNTVTCALLEYLNNILVSSGRTLTFPQRFYTFAFPFTEALNNAWKKSEISFIKPFALSTFAASNYNYFFYTFSAHRIYFSKIGIGRPNNFSKNNFPGEALNSETMVFAPLVNSAVQNTPAAGRSAILFYRKPTTKLFAPLYLLETAPHKFISTINSLGDFTHYRINRWGHPFLAARVNQIDDFNALTISCLNSFLDVLNSAGTYYYNLTTHNDSIFFNEIKLISFFDKVIRPTLIFTARTRGSAVFLAQMGGLRSSSFKVAAVISQVLLPGWDQFIKNFPGNCFSTEYGRNFFSSAFFSTLARDVDIHAEKLHAPLDGFSRNQLTKDALIDLERPSSLTDEKNFDSKAFEIQSLLYNLSLSFYVVFGVYYNIFYYPIRRVFESHPRMQELISGSSAFLRNYVTRQPKQLLWLSEFIVIYYACIYLRITEPLVRFIATRLGYEYR